jgi:uncharacterized caspase-like protein
MTSKYALCIGINDYPGTGSDLAGCVNDANDWAALLKSLGFEVKKLLDKQATRANILSEMGKMVSLAKKGDSIVFQYSGHGTYIPDEDGDEADQTDESLCPYDLRTKGVITDDQLFELFNKKVAGVRLVMISDSCHSGTVSRFVPTANARKKEMSKVKFLPPSAFLSSRELGKLGISRAIRRSSPPGRYGGLLLSGCQDVEYSYDAYFQGRPNGAFTYAALNTFKKLKPGASYKDWHTAIRKALPTAQYPQSPNLFGSATMKKWKALQ